MQAGETEYIAGKYQIVKLLGEGSSGQVYMVKHKELAVNYALKLLDPTLSSHQRFIERFKREAEVLLRFSHEGSIQLRDFGRTDDGRYYMAMDYSEGQVLKKVIQAQGNFSIETAFDIIGQLLAVLEAAHALGIIHRDIKPDNIMIEKGPGGRPVVRILDFGIAKLKESAEMDSSSTMEGASIGTPYYMSPEQASGEADLDHRVDLYAAGVVLYELLTGAVPFKGKTVLQTLLMHLTHAPAPFAARLSLPDFVEDLVFKSMQKLKEDRFQTASEFRKECEKTLLKFKDWCKTPQKEEVKTAPPSVASIATQVKSSPSSEKKTRILCLDDNEMVLNILKHLLDQQGFEVFTASNCSVVHNYIFKENIQLLISDVEMPDMRGTKVCQMLKKAVPELKIILFSNIDERELERASQDSNADGWISKNIKPVEWLAKIKEIIKQSETTSADTTR